jgi:hypothetical protein
MIRKIGIIVLGTLALTGASNKMALAQTVRVVCHQPAVGGAPALEAGISVNLNNKTVTNSDGTWPANITEAVVSWTFRTEPNITAKATLNRISLQYEVTSWIGNSPLGHVIYPCSRAPGF